MYQKKLVFGHQDQTKTTNIIRKRKTVQSKSQSQNKKEQFHTDFIKRNMKQTKNKLKPIDQGKIIRTVTKN